MADDEYNSYIALKRHLINAALNWCTELGYTPHLVVQAGYPVYKRDGSSEPFSEFININPDEYGVITFDVSGSAVRNFEYTNDYLYFETKFGGRVKAVSIPIGAIANVHSKETATGVPLPILDQPALVWEDAAAPAKESQGKNANSVTQSNATDANAPTKKKIPSFLTVVK